MIIFIDGRSVEVTASRCGSMWYTHPVNKRSCMQQKRDFVIGYHSRQGKVSRCNEIQKQFLKELHTENVSVRVIYKDAGYLHRTKNSTIQCTFIFEERDSSWGEQRLQELLDKVLELKVTQ